MSTIGTDEVFESLGESICDECLAGNEDCYLGGGKCYFWGDFEKLSELCRKVEELAKSIQRDARLYSEEDARLAALNI